MRIRFVRDIKDKNGVFTAGTEHDIDPTVGYGYIKDGAARKTPEGLPKPGQVEDKPAARRSRRGALTRLVAWASRAASSIGRAADS